MNTHLTDQQLIDYQFDLAEEAASNEARAHLEKCETCRKRLQELARKLSALELIRDDVKASPTLLSETIRGALQANGRRILLRRLPWLGAVAAAVVVGIALLSVPERATKDTAKFSVAEQPSLETAAAKGVADDVPELAMAASPKDGPVRSVPARAYPETPDGVTTSALAHAPGMALLGAIDEQPPFAPASAIELVVLPRRENVQLTIYNAADLTLVRERRNLTLKRGWNWLQFMWANTLIDPTSLTLEPLEHKDQVEIQQLVFPPRLRELGRWLIRSEIDGQVPFDLTYFTSGLTWRAFYMGTLSQDEKTMHLEGYVRVQNNSGEDYEDAHTRLVVGKTHMLDEVAESARRSYPYGRPAAPHVTVKVNGIRPLSDEELAEAKRSAAVEAMLMLRDQSASPKDIVKEGLSEYFLYTIEGTETIPNQWGKRLLSFEANDVPVASLCKYDEERWGDRTIRFLSFANDKEHKLGETPIPDGAVRIYSRADEQGRLSYVGGMDVKYIPVGEEVELELGPARLIEVKPILMDFRTGNHAFDTKGDVNGWDEVRTWKIEVVNAHTLPVKVEITRGFETPYWTLKLTNGDAAYRKHDATHARFELTVPPHQTQVFEYEVTTYHGVRQEGSSEK
ncbi:MAG: DUF4139 domain-containing protein [Phycisphaerales bacterium]